MTQMTTAEARAAGLLDDPIKASKTRTTRKTEPRNKAESHCLTHDEWFISDAGETRHVNEHHGCRIEFP
jgi:hypothetical protein